MQLIEAAIQQLPPGRYAIGASGGADSTALAVLLARRGDCEVTLVHLNHELREGASDADADFVTRLAEQLGLSCVVSRRSAIESTMASLPSNPSARYRAARFAFFTQVVFERKLDGIVLAHHADDQAETVLLRLLRGNGLHALGAMSSERRIDGVRVFRPLLKVRGDSLRNYLRSIDQPWREDASNTSLRYRRNSVRQWLTQHDDTMIAALIALAEASARLRSSLEDASPQLAERFACDALRHPQMIAEYAARRWLIDRGAPPEDVSPTTCRRLIAQALEVAQSPRQHYPGGVLVRRRQKWIDVMPGMPLQSARTHGKGKTNTTSEF